MSNEIHAIINSGNLPSLVATAILASQPEPPQIALIHIRDGRPTSHNRTKHTLLQAEHYNIQTISQAHLPNLNSTPIENLNELPPIEPLAQPQILLAAISLAVKLNATKITWPIQLGDNFKLISSATEQMLHTRQLAKADLASTNPIPKIETPLIDLTDLQLIELGAQLNCSWQLAWSCLIDHEKHCTACAACKKRMAAFAAAGITDTARQSPEPVNI